MKKFLEKTAEEILQKYGNDNSRHMVIIPNKRSEIFLRKYLKDKATGTMWMPEIITIDEFITNESTLANLDPLLVYFELFEIHKHIQREKALPLEDFLSWAPVMLSDFNDIDLQLADAEHVFRHLTEAKAIEQWNPGKKPLTELQKSYLSFFQSLYTYYTELRKNLLKQRSGFKGMIYRHLSENIIRLSQKWHGYSFTFVGFNALSNSELEIFGYIRENFPTKVYFDADAYYFDHSLTDKKFSGAGRFIHKIITSWHLKQIDWVSDELRRAKDKVEVIGVPKQIGQAKFAGQTLAAWLKEQNSESDNSDTAIVLADENLLIPLLHSLPAYEQTAFNITMGYPLFLTTIGRFTKLWISFIISLTENRTKSSMNTTNLLKLINDPVVQMLVNENEPEAHMKLVQDIISTERVYLDESEMFSLLKNNSGNDLTPLFKILLVPAKDAFAFFDILAELLIFLKNSVEKGNDPSIPFFKEQLTMTQDLLQKARFTLGSYSKQVSLKAFRKIWQQLMQRKEINLKGEPFKGVQIMGMLETRNLDFSNLIILGMNEGILPKKGNIESFIPFDIRHDHNLPLPKEQSEIMAYYFFRLLQRSNRVALIYNTDSDKFGDGEKSRFILQLEHELPGIFKNGKKHKKLVSLNTSEQAFENSVRIHKTKDVLKGIQRKARSGFSASSLNVYRNCPLKFYFDEIVELKTQQKIESDIEFNVFGNAIHAVLEKIYSNFIGKNIAPDKLKKFIPKTGEMLKTEFDKSLKGGNLQSGKNRLIYEMARTYVNNFLRTEIQDTTTPQKKIIGLEDKIEVVEKFGNHEVRLKGYIDRIEESPKGEITIIDYKTGGVEHKDLNLKGDDLFLEISSAKGKDKLFQLLFYAHLYQVKQNMQSPPKTGIYSLRKMSNGILHPNVGENLDFFEEYLEYLISEIFDSARDFVQTDNEDICTYCDYNEICNRKSKR